MAATAKTSKTSTPKRDVYAEVTNSIVSMLEKGTAPWRQSWNGTKGVGHLLPIRFNGVPYNGMNVILLWAAAQEKGYAERRWMTFNQAKKLGGTVRKGEKGTLIIKAGKVVKDVEDLAAKAKGETKNKTISIPYIKGYVVFNVCQIDWSEAKEKVVESMFEATKIEDATVNPDGRIAEAESFFTKVGADVRHGGSQAFYVPSKDYIQLPEFTDFHDAEAYYATSAHEHIHWTRHETRLNRTFDQKRFGDQGYAMEELVAELGAAFVCAQLGISAEPREDHASYLAHWIEVLKANNKAIFNAASHAQKATDFLLHAAGIEVLKGETDDEEVSKSATASMMAA